MVDQLCKSSLNFNQKWEIHKPLLKILYLEKRVRLQEIKSLMREHHDFDAEQVFNLIFLYRQTANLYKTTPVQISLQGMGMEKEYQFCQEGVHSRHCLPKDDRWPSMFGYISRSANRLP